MWFFTNIRATLAAHVIAKEYKKGMEMKNNREEREKYFKIMEEQAESREKWEQENPWVRINYKVPTKPSWKCPEDLAKKYWYYV